MKFLTDEQKELNEQKIEFNSAKKEKKKGWKKWFAWYPVTVEFTGRKVWLETIERQVFLNSDKSMWFDWIWTYTYRFKEEKK